MFTSTFKSLCTAVITGLLYIVLMSSVNVYAVSGSVNVGGGIVGDIYSETNQYRSKLGKTKLKPSSQLEIAATNKAQDMFKQQYWSHYGPDGSTPWSFIAETGYEYISAGENLAKGAETGSAAVNAWIASPAHDANLRGNYNEIGVGVVSGELNGVETKIMVAMYALIDTTTTAQVEQSNTTPSPRVTPTHSETEQGVGPEVIEAQDHTAQSETDQPEGSELKNDNSQNENEPDTPLLFIRKSIDWFMDKIVKTVNELYAVAKPYLYAAQ